MDTATNPATQRPRLDVHKTFPLQDGESSGAWTDRLIGEAIKHGVYRQCSLGWHDECSERHNPATDCLCNCICHVTTGTDALGVPKDPQNASVAPELDGGQYVRQAQVAAIREWVRTSHAELDQAQQVTGIDGDEFFRGIRSALKNASRRADAIEAGTHTVDSDH